MAHKSSMLNARVLGVSGVLLSLGVAAALLPPRAAGQSAPVVITTDTPEYCLHLLDQVSELMRIAPAPPPEVTSLSTEGQRMCGQGKTRGGIMRLRRALVLLRRETTPR